jgi:hypothetical protein
MCGPDRERAEPRTGRSSHCQAPQLLAGSPMSGVLVVTTFRSPLSNNRKANNKTEIQRLLRSMVNFESVPQTDQCQFMGFTRYQ